MKDVSIFLAISVTFHLRFISAVNENYSVTGKDMNIEQGYKFWLFCDFDFCIYFHIYADKELHLEKDRIGCFSPTNQNFLCFLQ